VQYNETMGKWLLAAALAALATGCKFGSGAFACHQDADCGAGGLCETATSSCTFADSSCASGRRYGDLSTPGGVCTSGGVIDGGMIDSASPEAGAEACYGSGLLRICLAAAPSEPRTFGAATILNTGDPAMCSPTVSGATGYCVIAATNLQIDARLRAIGPKPLVLLASGTITSSAAGLIDVGSHRERHGR
jgi:hypothetical protein